MTLVGLVIAGASIVAVDWGLYHLVRTGSCGTHPTYISQRPCPPGTGLHIFALVGGIFAGLVGIGLYLARGKGGRPGRVGIGLVMWFLLFATLTGAVALAAFGPANEDSTGAKAAAAIIAIIFVPMAIAPLPFALRGGKKRQLALDLMQRGKRCPGVVESVEDTNITINDNPRVKITVRAEPPGEAPFMIEKTATVSRVAIPRRGDRCTVFYDPADREGKNGITFDQVPGTATASASASSFSAGPAATPAPAPTAAAQSAEGDDDEALDKIERLAALHEKGLISQAEFDEQKRRLLGEV
jgi:hypothetical protein